MQSMYAALLRGGPAAGAGGMPGSNPYGAQQFAGAGGGNPYAANGTGPAQQGAMQQQQQFAQQYGGAGGGGYGRVSAPGAGAMQQQSYASAPGGNPYASVMARPFGAPPPQAQPQGMASGMQQFAQQAGGMFGRAPAPLPVGGNH